MDIRSSWPQPCPEPCAAYIWHPTIIVFDAVGRAIAFDFGSNNEFQEFMLSFGCADPRPPVCMLREGSMPDEGQWLCDLRPYSGQDGELSAGEYWIAVGNSIHPVQGVPWGAASTISPLNPGRRVDFWFRIQPPAIPYCDGDFNWDGSADQDDVLYLANVLAGGENPTGRWADYNRDGNEDQDDLLALVHTIAGGGCP
ncbi:MAG: hypothetical protein DYG92_14390 [Leptolyngbya sp. PLA1]|nr:hypothetical protein [Leptolyngbya sp. PLA1]